jgi:hypothetical protein
LSRGSGHELSRLALGEVWNMQVLARIAPRDDMGRPIYAKTFSQSDLTLVRNRVLNQCDALDGLRYGMINDWQHCGFRPSELTCTAGKTDHCLTAGQVGVLEDVMAGPRNAAGQHLYGPFIMTPAYLRRPGAECAWGLRKPASRTLRIRSSGWVSSGSCS